ncbi:uncharacterized protein [Drosophila pseudoobscura]|uniref:Uncharacterized protein n=1 Tax=Drosophila pseudoobscura pseudoobscura TaxID=46245 RepID=A0A6I8UZN3_DROPS|nr:uncharacterized protein LOC6902162 [Drosophila pseudoobscura]
MSPLEQITTKHLSSLFSGWSCDSNGSDEELTPQQESSGFGTFCLLYLGMAVVFFCINSLTDQHTEHQSRLNKKRRQRGRSGRHHSIAPRRRRHSVSPRKRQGKATEKDASTPDVWHDPFGQEEEEKENEKANEKEDDQQQGDCFFDILSDDK